MNWMVYKAPVLNKDSGKWEVTLTDEEDVVLNVYEYKTEDEANAAFKEFTCKLPKQDSSTKTPEADIELTDEQWDRVKVLWNSRPNDPPSIMELLQVAFKKSGLDGRTKEGKALKKKMAESGMKARSGYQAKGLIELKQNQKDYIKDNVGKLKAAEIAEFLFKKKGLTNLSQETRSVIEEIRKLKEKNETTFEDPDDIQTKDYNPPKTNEGVLRKINKYRHVPLDKDKLTGKQKKDVAALIGYMNTYRYLHQINTYDKTEDRELFESEFVRCCYDKYDLTEEEVDQYILYCTEVVSGVNIMAGVVKLRKMLDEVTDDEDKKIAMSLVEAINVAQTEYNQCVTRQDKLLSSLKVKRSEKEGKAKEGTASILNLVQTWKDEETRIRLIKYAEMKKANLKQSIQEYMDMDELRARMMGISVDEVLEG